MSSKILLVEDEKALRERFGDRLRKEGYKVVTADTFAEAKEIFKKRRFCLYIISLDLIDNSGLELCDIIREKSNNPLMCLVSQTDDDTIIKCLKHGADLCVKKPFTMSVMLERVKAMLRRSVNEESNSPYIYTTGNFTFDFGCREAYYMNKKIKLSKGEFDLLEIMVRNFGRVVDRTTMLEATGCDDAAIYEDNTLSVRISRLRDKLKNIDGEKYFVTVRGVGYRWEKPVKKELKRC